METWYDAQAAIAACGGNVAELHPWSLRIFSLWFREIIDAGQFLYAFSLPNSDYIAVGECLVRYAGSVPL